MAAKFKARSLVCESIQQITSCFGYGDFRSCLYCYALLEQRSSKDGSTFASVQISDMIV